MKTDWQHRTNKGRVVYDRPPHAWSFKDVVRIARQSDIVFFNIPLLDWESFTKSFEEFFLEEAAEFTGFGGGAFSGGGATRHFEMADPDEVVSSIKKGIIVLIRGEV